GKRASKRAGCKGVRAVAKTKQGARETAGAVRQQKNLACLGLVAGGFDPGGARARMGCAPGLEVGGTDKPDRRCGGVRPGHENVEHGTSIMASPGRGENTIERKDHPQRADQGRQSCLCRIWNLSSVTKTGRAGACVPGCCCVRRTFPSAKRGSGFDRTT